MNESTIILKEKSKITNGEGSKVPKKGVRLYLNSPSSDIHDTNQVIFDDVVFIV